MYVFIDTNIFLDFYHLSGPDLDELQKVTKLADNKKITLLITSQITNEFWRNRERVIFDALTQFAKTKAVVTLPNVIRVYPRAIDLRKAIEQVNDLTRDLRQQANEDIAVHKLKADEVIESLFNKVQVIPIEDKILEKARTRTSLGNPPGKNNSLGDAINWEIMLSRVPKAEPLAIVSSDSDYESELLKGKPREFLVREWRTAKESELEFYSGLPDFLRTYYPEIKLSGEIDKSLAIEKLEKTLSFGATHNAISALEQYDDFNEGELLRIIDVYITNNQVRWIIGDQDVAHFARKVVSLAKTDKLKEAVEPLLEVLAQLDASVKPEE